MFEPRSESCISLNLEENLVKFELRSESHIRVTVESGSLKFELRRSLTKGSSTNLTIEKSHAKS
jgi:hypothetical protein